MASITQQVRVAPGSTARLSRRDPADLLGLPDGKRRGRVRAAKATEQIATLQQTLWAEHEQSLLVVLQGLDASGKDGASRHLLTGVNPQGTQVTSFKAPTDEELRHDFLWRIHAKTPGRGVIAVFNRSHYEDVVTTQALGLIDANEASRRTRAINEFEQHLVEQGTTIVKLFLHISKEEQRQRLQERIDRPEKQWKMELSDLETRNHWDQYHELYERTISATSTDHAPWHIVPADHKWVRDIVVGELVVRALNRMDPKTPPPNPELNGIVVP
jgi:PPK2 family polyphosphate:nucleotide phosphotransferase